jgi:hypothetical protein
VAKLWTIWRGDRQPLLHASTNPSSGLQSLRASSDLRIFSTDHPRRLLTLPPSEATSEIPVVPNPLFPARDRLACVAGNGEQSQTPEAMDPCRPSSFRLGFAVCAPNAISSPCDWRMPFPISGIHSHGRDANPLLDGPDAGTTVFLWPDLNIVRRAQVSHGWESQFYPPKSRLPLEPTLNTLPTGDRLDGRKTPYRDAGMRAIRNSPLFCRSFGKRNEQRNER